MILNWKEERLNVIPIPAGKPVKGYEADSVILLPGVNEVPDEVWKKIRPSLISHLNARNLITIEENKIIEKEGKPDKNGKIEKIKEKTSIPKKFTELDPEECLSLIAQTNNLPTLEKWKKEEKREDVRIALMERLNEVEDYVNKKKSKKKGKK